MAKSSVGVNNLSIQMGRFCTCDDINATAVLIKCYCCVKVVIDTTFFFFYYSPVSAAFR